MSSHRFAEGEIVKARPHLLAPRTPSDSRPFAWPFYYPARITSLFGDDGAILEFLEHQHSADAWEQVITPWSREQGYSVKSLHALDCDCGTCDPNESLRDPHALIDQLMADLDGLGERRAEHTSRALRDCRFPGALHFVSAGDLARGDFLLFPQQHVHAAREVRGDVHLTFCHGTFVTGPRTRYLIHRPAASAPVCDPRSTSFDPRYTAVLTPSAPTLLEQAALGCLADLGLSESTSNDADSPVVTGAGACRGK
ncbi:hypothetical protein [Glycomyces harbinensis]|uniref:Uncharacterized protein n=1 Tax=Glycomyces harbinensis TaxID=58114 RepID=A0A1G6Y9Z2_9ACTN|nr:hypothetical protein [Glycomyces harbinensis]SDD87304.1 hypothetical protein SAMN05216270_108224 [Glycomyces harbinensis]